tara:strand:- start:4682 stop:4933 length:252 start_codon:yes stop_codon:yes gene_type:complete
MENRFTLGKISEDIFEKRGPKLKAQIDKKTKQLLNLSSKKSNHQKLLKKSFKIAENVSEFYESLNYNKHYPKKCVSSKIVFVS